MKYLLVFILSFSFAFGKKDFFYGFVDSTGVQISQKKIQEISEGFDNIKNIRQMARDGKIDEAYAQIKAFKELNKVSLLKTDIIILYSELALKKGKKRIILEATKELEDAINDSVIYEDDLARAYMVLVELKLNTNKAKDAKYFANIIINNFDSNVTKAYGSIYLAKVYKHQKDYSRATRILYEVLTKTTDVLVATLVADELFDVYILDDKRAEAYELISKVLKKNIDYYASDSYLALQKVDRLIKANMPEFAIEILKELLSRTNKPDSIEDFKYKLANTYMLMYDGTDKYLNKAKELYKDILNDYPNGIYFEKSKVFLDEILMREGVLKTTVLASKYKNSESMQQKVLLQELLNLKKEGKYEFILKSKRVYKKISNSIAQRFGYDSVEKIFDEVNIDLINKYLNSGKCFLLNDVLKTSRNETLELLVKDEKTKDKFFECLIEVPYKKAYLLLKDTFNESRNANIYLYLERMAYALKDYNEALEYSAKVDMVDNKEVLKKEFLIRFLIISAKGDSILFDKYFNYAHENPQLIAANEDNPVIIDFYYQYYLYLIKKDLKKEANEILKKLYDKQKELKVHVYSPFVELELSKLEISNNNNQKALDLLLDSLEYSRKIKPNDLARIYYDIIRLYDEFKNTIKKDEYILKCKEIKGTKDSLYKKMCDEM
ncbi:MAG: tetratricopeptide repeat protein [Halarcobacter sp.]